MALLSQYLLPTTLSLFGSNGFLSQKRRRQKVGNASAKDERTFPQVSSKIFESEDQRMMNCRQIQRAMAE
jgi:hypothetical protein